jgi:hypothetical protein
MIAVPSLLAEVADKEFAVSTLWIIALALSAVGFLLARWRRWAAIAAVIVASVWAYLIVSELRDRFVGPAIAQELGQTYVVQSYISAVLPFLFLALGFLRSRPHAP